MVEAIVQCHHKSRLVEFTDSLFCTTLPLCTIAHVSLKIATTSQKCLMCCLEPHIMDLVHRSSTHTSTFLCWVFFCLSNTLLCCIQLTYTRSIVVNFCPLTIAHSDRLPPWPLSLNWGLSKSGPCQQIQTHQYQSIYDL